MQVCFNLADDLRNMRGKGARLFAKRQAKSESWTVSTDDDDATTTEPTEPSSVIQEKLSAQHKPAAQDEPTSDEPAVPVNRLKGMVELPRPAMSPWEAAAKYGTVDPAFAHLSAAGESSTSGRDGDAASRVKSWAGNQDPAAS